MAHIITLPTFKLQGNVSQLHARTIAERWIRDFEDALRSNDRENLEKLFVKDAWIRDLLALSWDFRTLQSRDNVLSYLQENHDAGIKNLRLRDYGSFQPAFRKPYPDMQWVESMFDFESRYGGGKGMLRLVLDGDNSDEWKCYLIHFVLQELKDCKEKTGFTRPEGYVDTSGGNWQQRRERQREFLDEDPAVLIVGAGQSGLSTAARLQQLGVPALIIEKNGRVGDSWRKRYKTLMTHDPIQYCHLPYIPFPAHWPLFMPKDKLADWLEAYASLMELNVWCSTELQTSSFDDAAKVWTVTVKRPDGSTRTIKPRHVVLATGNAGDAIIPHFDGIESFKGSVYHGSQHKDASEHADLSSKHVVVIGSGTSSHDLCQNFYECGAASVTMLQRGSSHIMTAKKGLAMLHSGTYEEGGPPTEDCDVYSQSMPIPVQFATNVYKTNEIKIVDKDILEGLEKVGFQLDFAEDGSGIYRKYITKGGGYYIDVGCSQLIIDGKVKLKVNPGGIKSFTPDGLLLADGSELKADIVLLATGYQTMHSTARSIFGDKVASRLGKVWDLNEEGEINSIWRYSGHPNFWFMGGSLALCRTYSRMLALQIKASELGIYEAPGKKVVSNGVHNGV
ncbi:FAD/NAD(P)-binding domain-containing protein [Trichoderma citrinoviride]|uniref:FAD/NAD(P)-binding domain-containing protein n=1 Tax=Trichoderma citrinoviride TaxID=58853 RepID=A0A2T4AYI4_9HYPO|nr:FAD/NAD(P)-binding domain-containing protein [Trichoderma citrinoviride]PTB62021.1 FAD/NAD(P)-binding domain-containing protein [Trichoderma citrinoviride]